MEEERQEAVSAEYASIVEDLTVQFQQLLVTPPTNPYTAVRNVDRSTTIGKFNFISLVY